jgi:predicted nucleotidyltransferase
LKPNESTVTRSRWVTAESSCKALPSVRALILGGSIAHGFARPDSDVDVSIVVDGADYQRRVRENRLHLSDSSMCDYDGGYVDGKFVDLEFLRRVAATGSDPARYAYQGARILFSRVPELDGVLTDITRYPVAEKADRLERFAGQLLAWRWYFEESARKQSRYLEVLALSKLVLFTCRIVLAANELFYPFHKWLLRVTQSAPHRTEHLLTDLDDLLRTTPPVATVDAQVTAILEFYGIDAEAAMAVWPTRFMKDTELAWLSGSPGIDDL